jgi:hypothetical protein
MSMDSEGKFATKFARIKNLNSNKQQRVLPPVAESYTVPSSIHEEAAVVYRRNRLSQNHRSGNNSSSRQPEVEETIARTRLHHQTSYKSLLEEMRTNKSKSSLQTYMNETEGTLVRDEIYNHDPNNLIILVGEHKRLLYYDTSMSKWN